MTARNEVQRPRRMRALLLGVLAGMAIAAVFAAAIAGILAVLADIAPAWLFWLNAIGGGAIGLATSVLVGWLVRGRLLWQS